MAKKSTSENTKNKVQKEIKILLDQKYIPISKKEALFYAEEGFPVISGISGAKAENFIMGAYIKSWIVDLHKYSKKQEPSLVLKDYSYIFTPDNVEQIEMLAQHFSINAAYVFITKLIKSVAKF